MSSRFNKLLHGDPREVAYELDVATTTTTDELRIALINALNSISRLQEEVETLRRQVPGNR